ncbi:YopX family protein [Bacillus cereus]|nr:YopX family protein [Bacillus cereus]MCU5315709.1 YopX family protein [Bacillus cereus]MCU5481183.1 YopX family protein [Bacillus cereus]
MQGNKFRAWDEELKKMYSGDEIEVEDNLDAWLSYGELAIYRIDDGEYVQLKPLRYIGLLDVNGQEIYEGDIVKISGHPFDVDGKYKVYYNEHMELSCGPYHMFRMKNWAQVIGSIYESPELLEN